MGKIVVIGSANIDCTKEVHEFPTEGSEQNEISSTYGFGGKGTNQAIAASRSGSEVSFIGCIGEDEYSRKIVGNLESNGIDVKGVKAVLGLKKPDGRTIYVRGHDGENAMTGYGEAIGHLTPEVIEGRREDLDNADIIIIQYKMPKESVDFVIEYCKENRKKLIVNPAPPEQAKLDISKMSSITYLTPNQYEAPELFPGLSFEEIVTRYPNVIITLGKDGVMYYDNGAVKTLPALEVECIDTTGAGDTFTGAFATAVSEGKSLEEAVLFGRTAAGMKVKQKGAQPGIPNRPEIEKAIRNEREEIR